MGFILLDRVIEDQRSYVYNMQNNNIVKKQFSINIAPLHIVNIIYYIYSITLALEVFTLHSEHIITKVSCGVHDRTIE
jgi:hypothetical protein